MTVKTQKPVKNLALYIGGGGLAFQAPDTRRLCPRLTNREFFLKISSLCDHDTATKRTDRRTDNLP